MSAKDFIPADDAARAGGLVALLREAQGALMTLRTLTDRECRSSNLRAIGFRENELRFLCAVLADGSFVLHRRAIALGAAFEAEAAPARGETDSGNAEVEPLALIGAYRKCCRRLCDAIKEAVRISDPESISMLRELILRLEKQLWVIDLPSRNCGVGDSRAVALFLSC